MTALLQDLVRAPEPAGWDVPLSPGEVVGRFEVVREIGRGGFGVVYEVKDRELGRSVAFKAVRRPSSTADVRALAEAEAAARLAHPNIVHLYDVGTCERGPYLIMELLHGETLAEKLERGPLAPREAVRVAAEMARGLAHAHAQGVVHRDLKPGNVFVCEDGQVKVLDFGMAHVFGRAGLTGGTPAYMAPEQARGETGDERSDVYSLGVMLREILPSGPAAQLAGRMLAQDPASRPADGREVHAALARIQRVMEPKRLLWAAWALAGIAAAAAVALGLRARPLPPGRLLTAISDTANATGDPDLDGFGELLRVGLEQSSRLSVMGRPRLVNALREASLPIPARIDERLARRAAPQAQVLIVPIAEPDGQRYRLTVRGIDPVRSDTLFTVRELVPVKSMLRGGAEDLTRRIRAALREEEAGRGAPVVPVTELAPANPEAWRWYAEGRRLRSLALFKDAVEAYRRALSIDPEFALAHLDLPDVAWAATGQGVDRLEPLIDECLAWLRLHLDRFSAQDRAWAEHLVLVNTFERPTDVLEERARLERHVQKWPEDYRPYERLAGLLVNEFVDVEAARPYVERAAALSPLHLDSIVDGLEAVGDHEQALARVRRWTEEAPSWHAFLNLAGVLRSRGQVREALDAARRAIAMELKPTQTILFAYADGGAIEEYEAALRGASLDDSLYGVTKPVWYALRGRIREGLARRDVENADRKRRGEQFSRFMWTQLHAIRGDPGGLWTDLQAQFATGDPNLAGLPCQAWQLAALGDLDHAGWLSIIALPREHVCVRMTRLLLQWKRGDREGALRELATLPIGSSAVYRGEILVELGRDAQAVEEFRLARRRIPAATAYEWLHGAHNYTRSLYLEAAALERLGRREEARQAIGRLLQLWDHADPDLPLLEKAKDLRARLAGTP